MKTLGEFYREKILSQNDLIPVEWPYYSDDIEIKKDLFSWKLFFGKKFIECRSEEEARYLKVFFEAGMREVSVPKEDDYLSSILPELEQLKARIDEIVNEYLEGILRRKVRERIRHEVFMEIIK